MTKLTATEWMPISTQIVGNVEQWEIIHYPGPRCATARAAFKAGYRMANDTDDFLIAAVEGNLMLNLTGSDMKALDTWEADDYQQVADSVGLKCDRRTA